MPDVRITRGNNSVKEHVPAGDWMNLTDFKDLKDLEALRVKDPW